jgi:hypothetical protein
VDVLRTLDISSRHNKLDELGDYSTNRGHVLEGVEIRGK